MREVKPEWIAQLQALTGRETDTIRWNTLAQRYEFILASADGVPRSQFWCRFDATRVEHRHDPVTGRSWTEVVPDRDPVSGLLPYRDLNDAEMRVALANLERTFVGNPFDGNGTPAREVGRRYFFNKRLTEQRWKENGERLADFVWEHRRQIRDAGAGPLVNVPQDITKRRIEVVPA